MKDRLDRSRCRLGLVTLFLLALPLSGRSAPTVDLSAYQAGSAVQVSSPGPAALEAVWSDKSGAKYRVAFDLTPGRPLFRSLAVASTSGGKFGVVAENVDPRYRVTLGARHEQAGWPYIFFDKVPGNTPAPEAHLSTLNPTRVRVINESKQRVRIVFSTLASSSGIPSPVTAETKTGRRRRSVSVCRR